MLLTKILKGCHYFSPIIPFSLVIFIFLFVYLFNLFFQGKHLVSVGFPHDGYICLWDWQKGLLVAKLKSSLSCSAIASVSFSLDGKLIVTAGKKHLKFWMIGSSTRPCTDTGTGAMTMHGKPVNLGYHKGSSFTSVSSPIWAYSSLVSSEQSCVLFPIYALTDGGENYIISHVVYAVHIFV